MMLQACWRGVVWESGEEETRDGVEVRPDDVSNDEEIYWECESNARHQKPENVSKDSSSIVLWLNKTSRIHRVGSLTTVPRQRYPSLAAVEPPVRAEVQLLRQGAIPVIQFSSQRSTRYSVCLSLSQERYDGNQNKLDQLLHRVLIYRMPSL